MESYPNGKVPVLKTGDAILTNYVFESHTLRHIFLIGGL